MLKNIALLILASTISYTIACESPKQQLTRHQTAQLKASRKALINEMFRINEAYGSHIAKYEGSDAVIMRSPEKPTSQKEKTQSRIVQGSALSKVARKLNFE